MPITTTTEENVGTPGHTIQPKGEPPVAGAATGSAILPQNTQAPEWWYQCFRQGHHDLSIYEIEWAWEAFTRLSPNNV